MNKLLKEYNRFLQNIKEMSYIDWKIDKRLVEAGGLGKTVYIYPARGSCRIDWGLLHELTEGGRDVRVVTTKKETPKPTAEEIEQFRCYMRIMNEERERYERYWDYLIGDVLKREPEKPMVWISSAGYDSYIFDVKNYSVGFPLDRLTTPSTFLGVLED